MNKSAIKDPRTKRAIGALGVLKKPEVTVLLALIAICLLMAIARPSTFLTVRNFFNILRQFSLVAILAVGMGFIIITGGIDLSVGSVIAFSSCLAAFATRKLGLPAVLTLVVVLAAGSLFGAANGLLITKAGIPPFIVTLGTMSIASGVALLITNGSPIPYKPSWVSVFGGGYIGPIPVSVLIMLVVVILGHIFANYTQTGRNIYAIGNSEKSAKFSGISVDNTVCLVYIILGFLSGLCGLLLIGQMNSADPSFGSGYEMDVIAASVIGGISMSGGKGNILGVVVGAALMGVLKNMFVLLAISGYWQTIIIGSVIILAVAIDSIRKRRIN